MTRLLLFLKTYVLPLGGLGIFAITFLDSAFVPMPSILDMTFIGFCLAHRSRIIYYCLMATAGSVAGCYVLFQLARQGSRFARKRSTGSGPVVATLNRHGAKMLVIASLMPPPFPFKVFVFASGFLRITTLRFLLAIAIGRGFRFGFEGAFAYLYGDLVIEYMKRDFARLSLIVVAVLVALFLVSYLLKRILIQEEKEKEPAVSE